MITANAGDYERTDPDVRLMLRVRDDDKAAFNEIVRRYEDRVAGVLHLLISNHHQAEDLVQEVFLRVFRSRKTYRPNAKFSTWLYVIVSNVVSNARRAQSRRLEVSLPDNEFGNPLDQFTERSETTTPAGDMERDELRSMVWRAVERLGERQKKAVLLQRFECLKYEEIAETMQTSPQAIKSLLARARVTLRGYLAPYVISSESVKRGPVSSSPAG